MPGGTNQIGVSHFKCRVVAKIGVFDRVFPRRRVVEANKDARAATFSSVDLFVSFLISLFLLLILLLSLRTGAATAKR